MEVSPQNKRVPASRRPTGHPSLEQSNTARVWAVKHPAAPPPSLHNGYRAGGKALPERK